MGNRYGNDRYDREEGGERPRGDYDRGDSGFSPTSDRSDSYFGGGRRGPSYGSGYTGSSYERGESSLGSGYDPEVPTYRDRYHQTGEWMNDRDRDEPYRPSRRDYRNYGNSRPSSEAGFYSDRDRQNRSGERGWWDRTSDEVSSWFGDEDALRRRERDARRQDNHRGRGPNGYKRSDERIREDVNDRFTDSPYLDATNISVEVEDGDVTLTGTVNSRYGKRLAEDIAENVSAVSNLENRIRVERDISQTSSSAHGTSSTATYPNSDPSTPKSQTKTA